MSRHIKIYLMLSVLALIGFSTVLFENTAQASDKADLILNSLSARPPVKGQPPVYQTFPTEWSILQCDEKPSVNVAGSHGYRIVLKSPVKLMDASKMRQSGPMPTESEYITHGYVYVDAVLFPVSKTTRKIKKGSIPWLDLEQYCYADVVDMGEGHGYRWFAKAPIMFQDLARTRLGLTGGDDRLQILTNALAVKDKHGYTTGYASVALQRVGNKAFPYIKKAIRKHHSDDLNEQIYVLSRMSSNDATKLLISLCKSKDKKIADWALYTLINPPYKKSAKPQYMELLQQGKYIDNISNICVEFGWKDTLPLLEKASAKIEYWPEYRRVYENMRKLENKPASASLTYAEKIIRQLGSIGKQKKPSSEQIEQAKKAILGAQDKEYAAVIAASLALYTSKANLKPVHEVGMEVLEAMPKAQRLSLLAPIVSMQAHNKSSDINRVYELLIEGS